MTDSKDDTKIKVDRPCWGAYQVAVRNEKGDKLRPGVYWHGFQRGNGEDGDPTDDKARQPRDEWICTPVFVEAITSTGDSNFGRLLKLVTDQGTREWVMPMEMFGRSGVEIRRMLFAMGVLIAPRKRGRLLEYLIEQKPARTIVTTGRTGWHDTGAFVLPRRTYGGDVRFQSSGRAPDLFRVRGELAQWQEQVGAKCVGNPVLTLAVGCALAGPLLKLVGMESGGVHLVGDSSNGRSLALGIASSVWGDPGPAGFGSSWGTTKNGLEIEAALRNDTVLTLDEIKRANPKDVQGMVYTLASGSGNGTMTRARGVRQNLIWRLLTLSSGERSMAEHAALSGNPVYTGAELRMVDVNAGTRTHGAFDDCHGLDGAGFHRDLSRAIGEHHGHLGPAFVEKLTAEGDHDKLRADLLEAFAKLRDHFRSGSVHVRFDSAQSGRVADRFAVIALAGERAIAYGLLPWKVGTAMDDAKRLYSEWLEDHQ